MLVVGLTGGIGAGKTTVANLFAKRGVPIIDADLIARKLTMPGQAILENIVAHFPNHNLLLKDGNLNRAELRNIIFSDPEAKQWLENLLHPVIEKEMKASINELQSAYCIVVIPLLIEVGQYPYIDRVLVVDSSLQNQVQRVMNRDNVPSDHVLAIINTQVERGARLAKAHDVINNDEDLKSLDRGVEKMHYVYLELAKVKN